MFDRILVVLGLLSRTWSVIPYIRHMAKEFGAEMHLLGLSSEPQPVWDQSLLNYINGISRSLKEDNIPVCTNFIHGNPAVEVARYSKKNAISLIATTTGSANEITCSILSSVFRRMGVDFSIPILTVPPQVSKDFDIPVKYEILRLLVPLDRTPIGESALPYVETLASKFHCSVMLLNVNTPPVRGVPVLNSEVVRIKQAAGVNYLKDMCHRLRKKNISADYQVVGGTATKAILKFARTYKFDMIVMAAHGTSGMESWFQRHTAAKVSEKAGVPVMSICNPDLDLTRAKGNLFMEQSSDGRY